MMIFLFCRVLLSLCANDDDIDNRFKSCEKGDNVVFLFVVIMFNMCYKYRSVCLRSTPLSWKSPCARSSSLLDTLLAGTKTSDHITAATCAESSIRTLYAWPPLLNPCSSHFI